MKKKKGSSLTTTSPIPKEVHELLTIRMLGEPLAFYEAETGKIIRGWKYNGKNYLENPSK